MEIDESKLFCPVTRWQCPQREVKRDVKIKDVNNNIRLKTLITIEWKVERHRKFNRKDVGTGTFTDVSHGDDRQKNDKDRQTM
jgi:hypothetical protein